MADHNKPTTTSTYANFVSEAKGRIDDALKGLDPATTSPTNVPTDAIRWTGAAKNWQKWNGSAWGALTDVYAISVSTAATLTTARTIALSGGVTGTATSFNGSANITIPVTSVDATKISGLVDITRGGTGAYTAEGARASLGLGEVDNTADADKPVSTAQAAAINAVVQTIETADGICTRYLGGQQICEMQPASGGLVMTTGFGSVYMSAGIGRNFPATFHSAPVVHVDADSPGQRAWAANVVATTSGCSYVILNPVSTTSVVGEKITATGRWHA